MLNDCNGKTLDHIRPHLSWRWVVLVQTWTSDFSTNLMKSDQIINKWDQRGVKVLEQKNCRFRFCSIPFLVLNLCKYPCLCLTSGDMQRNWSEVAGTLTECLCLFGILPFTCKNSSRFDVYEFFWTPSWGTTFNIYYQLPDYHPCFERLNPKGLPQICSAAVRISGRRSRLVKGEAGFRIGRDLRTDFRRKEEACQPYSALNICAVIVAVKAAFSCTNVGAKRLEVASSML